MRQVRALTHSSGHSLEDARQAVSDTEAGRQLRDLAQGEHHRQKAKQWQASVFWERAEERFEPTSFHMKVASPRADEPCDDDPRLVPIKTVIDLLQRG
jgi:hypothetical protein